MKKTLTILYFIAAISCNNNNSNCIDTLNQNEHPPEEHSMLEFNGDEYYKLYNANRQPIKVGIFEDYKLVHGLLYTYNENDSLENIKLIEDGVVIKENIPIDSISYYFQTVNDSNRFTRKNNIICGTPFQDTILERK